MALLPLVRASEANKLWFRAVQAAPAVVRALSLEGDVKGENAALPKRTPPSPRRERKEPAEALRGVKESARARFQESVDIAIRLGIDPKRTDKPVRSSAILPHGVGKELKVAAFAEGEQAERARESGASVVGGEELVSRLEKGGSSEIDFDRAVSTPAMITSLRRVAKILGPRGLMPTPRAGTVADDVGPAVAAAKQGQVNFRADRYGIVHARIGSTAFSEDALLDNLFQLLKEVEACRPPPGVPGGSGGLRNYFRKVYFSSTMGPSFEVDVQSLLRAAKHA